MLCGIDVVWTRKEEGQQVSAGFADVLRQLNRDTKDCTTGAEEVDLR